MFFSVALVEGPWVLLTQALRGNGYVYPEHIFYMQIKHLAGRQMLCFHSLIDRRLEYISEILGFSSLL